MRCPFCHTENRNERDTCYNCQKDLAMLRLLINKARAHFNSALELAERDRVEEAITELLNALELDYTHVPSHVVLGTLYAKLGNLEKAEACWQHALSIDPQIERAHEYLKKTESVIQSLPICQRQRRTIWGLGVACVVLAVVLVVFNVWQRPGMTDVNRAWKAYKNHQYADAIQCADKVKESTTAPLAQAEQALLIQEVILAEQELLCRSAQLNLDSGKLKEARGMLAELLQRNPPEATRTLAQKILGQVREQARKNLSDTLGKYQFRAATLADVNLSSATYSQVAGDQVDQEYFGRVHNDLTNITRTLKLENATVAFQKKEMDNWQFLQWLNAIQLEYPDWPTPGKMAADISQGVVQEFKTAFDKKDFEKATTVGQRLLAEVSLTTETRAVVEPLLARADKQLARTRWDALEERDWKILSGKLTLQEAEAIVKQYPQMEANLKGNAAAKDKLPLYVASAQAYLGQAEKAQALLTQIEQQPNLSEDNKNWVRSIKKRMESQPAKQ
ncbi:TPA: hypothetical protein DDW35_12745 [Candidatus Sumerlaeota bacterium]|jgi:tetratricopeptide (TPR) repeat protein|nr:hypothetical protein [Candidatus Sumerlaeota bacterium]